MKAICPGCGKPVQVRPTRGGDGSAVRVSRHKADPTHAVSCWGAYRTLDRADTLDDADVVLRPGATP